MKKWVLVRLSQYKLDKAETSVLGKGLNFALSPSAVPVRDFVLTTEKTCSHLPSNQAEVMRLDKAKRFENARLANPNIN